MISRQETGTCAISSRLKQTYRARTRVSLPRALSQTPSRIIAPLRSRDRSLLRSARVRAFERVRALANVLRHVISRGSYIIIMLFIYIYIYIYMMNNCTDSNSVRSSSRGFPRAELRARRDVYTCFSILLSLYKRYISFIYIYISFSPSLFLFRGSARRNVF
jgi:hypothetical protein